MLIGSFQIALQLHSDRPGSLLCFDCDRWLWQYEIKRQSMSSVAEQHLRTSSRKSFRASWDRGNPEKLRSKPSGMRIVVWRSPLELFFPGLTRKKILSFSSVTRLPKKRGPFSGNRKERSRKNNVPCLIELKGNAGCRNLSAAHGRYRLNVLKLTVIAISSFDFGAEGSATESTVRSK